MLVYTRLLRPWIISLSPIESCMYLLRTIIVVFCLWSFMTMAFFGMLRASNLISRTPYCFNPTEQLIRRCAIFTKEGMLLHLLWSKTRQGHDYIHELSICRSSEPLLCPVKAYCHFISLVPGGGDDPVFAVPVKGKLEPVSKHAFLNALEKCYF